MINEMILILKYLIFPFLGGDVSRSPSALLTFQEIRSIHDSMNIPKIESIS